MALSVVIMAAGKGTRMRSARPKVLHALGGAPLLAHVLATAEALAPTRCVVVTGHGAAAVETAFAGAQREFVRQMPQLGTGPAVQQATPLLPDTGVTLVLNGDVPLIRAETLRALVAACDGRHLALLTVTLDQPFGYGRILYNLSESSVADQSLADLGLTIPTDVPLLYGEHRGRDAVAFGARAFAATTGSDGSPASCSRRRAPASPSPRPTSSNAVASNCP